MTTFKVGDNIVLCASLRDSCFQNGNFYLVHDVNCNAGTCNIVPSTFSCLSPSGKTVEFKWTATTSDITDCRQSIVLKNIGNAYTNSSGVASLQYQIQQEDLSLYNANHTNTTFDLTACINGGTMGRYSKSRRYGVSSLGDNIQIISGTSVSTDYIDIKIKPYSWYTPQGASDYLINKIADINGKITNFFSGFTGWQYVSTEIFPDNNGYVMIRINLNNISGQSIEPQAMPIWILQIGTLLVAMGIIFISIGIISDWAWNKYGGLFQQGKVFTSEEVTKLVVEDIVPAQITECKNNFLPSNPVGYANCAKSVVCGAHNGLTDALTLQKYGVDCTSLNINQDFDECINKYNTDGNITNLQSCIDNASKKNNPIIIDAAVKKQSEGCIIKIPFTNNCIIYEKDLIVVGAIGAVLVGGYLYFINKDKIIFQREEVRPREYKENR